MLVLAMNVASCSATNVKSDDANSSPGPSTVHNSLLAVLAEYKSYRGRELTQRSFEASESSLQIIDDRVTIDAVAMENGQYLASQLESLGATHVAVVGLIVSCRLPILAIEHLEKLDSLRFANPAIATTDE